MQARVQGRELGLEFIIRGSSRGALGIGRWPHPRSSCSSHTMFASLKKIFTKEEATTDSPASPCAEAAEKPAEESSPQVEQAATSPEVDQGDHKPFSPKSPSSADSRAMAIPGRFGGSSALPAPFQARDVDSDDDGIRPTTIAAQTCTTVPKIAQFSPQYYRL